jgi:glycosyltransferase involved in cell wall biosynthesis
VSPAGAVGGSPKVSVVIPAHNHARFLPDALASVRQQTWREFDVVVVDDGSTDNTAEVVAGFAPHVRYLYQPNAGPSSARNTGIRHTHGEYVAFLDADDTWMPEKLALQVEYLDAHPDAGLVFTKVLVMSEAGQPLYTYPHRYRYGRRAFARLLLWPYGSMNVVMVRRACFERFGLFDESLPAAEDWDMWLRVAPFFRLGFLDRPLGTYRQSSNSVSRGSGVQQAPEAFRRVLDKLFSDPERLAGHSRAELARLRRLAYASLEVTVALNMATNPWPHLLRAVRLHPGIAPLRWRAVGLLLLRPFLGEGRMHWWDERARRFVRRSGTPKG